MSEIDFRDVGKAKVENVPGVRVYGMSVGNGSLQRVVAGMRQGLGDLGALAGFMPTDTYDDNEVYDGAFAEVAIHEGIPRTVMMMSSRGFHEKTYAVIAPNSSWLPEEIIELVLKHAKIATPSKWGARVLANYAPADRICVYRHGVDDGFKPDREARSKAYDDFQRGSFNVLHLSSSDRERKGTCELIQAWSHALQTRRLGPDPHLNLIISGIASEYHAAVEEWCRPEDQRTIVITPARNLSVDKMAALYNSQHVVCQPSRGEGFGMVPIEARVCGVPVVATDCTGHGEHLTDGDPGVVIVPTGDCEPIDDGPGALAPSLRSSSVEEALERAYCDYGNLAEEALGRAGILSAEWAWAQTTGQWLIQEGIEWT